MKPRSRSFHSAADTKLVSCDATHDLAKCWRCSRGFLRYCPPSALGIGYVSLYRYVKIIFDTQRRIVCSCHKDRWKTPALSEV